MSKTESEQTLVHDPSDTEMEITILILWFCPYPLLVKLQTYGLNLRGKSETDLSLMGYNLVNLLPLT